MNVCFVLHYFIYHCNLNCHFHCSRVGSRYLRCCISFLTCLNIIISCRGEKKAFCGEENNAVKRANWGSTKISELAVALLGSYGC